MNENESLPLDAYVKLINRISNLEIQVKALSEMYKDVSIKHAKLIDIELEKYNIRDKYLKAFKDII